MRTNDPNIAKVELVARALGDLCDDFVFVGGCAAGLLITDNAAPPVRVTYDVDLLVQVASRIEYRRAEKQLAGRGFKRDLKKDAPICRWTYNELEVDLMPIDPTILGFSNRWYAHASATATRLTLPSGRAIKLISAASFVATKFEAFNDRGKSDPLGSHDLEDILNVLEGRPGIVDEISKEDATLRAYLSTAFHALTQLPNFSDYLPGLLSQDELLNERVAIVRARIDTIVGLT
ncbi:MAG: hypothetical protein ACK5UX_13890 [Burkholderiales bacterium]|jgi:hypothetical protein|nr:nucleotidyl transferase AbiEii/AbiGii toxin family protein [Nitrosomonadaceae bacterium]